MKNFFRWNWIRAIAVGLLFVTAWPAAAQWTRQSVTLRPGWNAVFLEVQPEPESCDAQFGGLPVESVWDFNRIVDLPQFVQDPTTLTPGTPGWLTWFPANHPLAGQGNLFSLRDGRAYLIKVASNTAPVEWIVTGRPSLRRTSWTAGGMNFVGFHSGANGPSFQTLFAGEPGLAGQPVYSLDTSGVWRRVLDPSTSRARAGQAYWIRCASPAQRAGTIVVDPGSRDGMIFQPGATEQSLRVRNTSGAARTIALRVLPSVIPPLGQPALAGPVPLEYRRTDYGNANFTWEPMSSALTFANLAPGAEWSVRLGARLPATPLPPGAQYQSILEVSDDAGTRWVIPLRALRETVSSSSGGLALAAAPGAMSPYAGLWLGEATLKAVSQPAHLTDGTTARTSGGEFPFRLILHVDSNGTSRLLQHAYVVRQPAILSPDPDDPENNRVDRPARTLVVTDESLLPGLLGTGAINGRRISSAAFGFSSPVEMTGGAFGGGTLGAAMTLDYNHPLNPFRHRFHPDHNNLDERYEQTLPEGKESFTVRRAISLEFTATDPSGQNPPGWGESELGGVYRETLDGLHRSPVYVRGHFRLTRATSAPALNQ